MLYSKKLMEHFTKPHNVGELKNPDGVGEVGNMRCGDIMRLFIKVKSGKIDKIKFRTTGCAAAIATSSVVTDLAKGKKIEEALKITSKDVVNALDGMPAVKVHCSILAIDALHEAVYEYYTKKGIEIPPELEEEHARIQKCNNCHAH